MTHETENKTKYSAICPSCDQDTTFSKGGGGGSFNNLSCDACGYTPRRKVRYEIRGEEMP